MTAEEHERAMLEVSMVLLGAANLLDDAAASLKKDEELLALNEVLVGAHLFMREMIRRLYPEKAISAFPATELSTRRAELGASLSTAAAIFTRTARESREWKAPHTTTTHRTPAASATLA
ncbi:MAG: hypothetical protein V7638_423 [Acidobacteriota bacterium]|jgi:type II secretory pathway component PulJ